MSGKLRETFVVNQIQNAKHQIYYSELADFKINDVTLEIGEKNKSKKQLKHSKNAFVLSDDILIGGEGKTPLYLLGLLS